MDKQRFYDTEYGKCWRACAAVAFSHQVFEYQKINGEGPSQKDYEDMYEEAAYIASEFAERAAPMPEKAGGLFGVPAMVKDNVGS